MRRSKAKLNFNAFMSFDAKCVRALAQAANQRSTSRLRGAPRIVKDNIEVAKIQHTAGTPGLLGYILAAHAPVIDALVSVGGDHYRQG